jgi:hypothetical protein
MGGRRSGLNGGTSQNRYSGCTVHGLGPMLHSIFLFFQIEPSLEIVKTTILLLQNLPNFAI